MSYRIVLSHSGSDRAWAEWIAASGKQFAIEVYLFEHDPKPGVLVASKIQAAIQGSDALIVLLTSIGASSAYVQQEIGYATAAGKLVIPLVWPGVGRNQLAMLEGREWVEFNPTNPEHSLVPLFNYLTNLRTKKEGAQAILALAGLIIAAVAISGDG